MELVWFTVGICVPNLPVYISQMSDFLGGKLVQNTVIKRHKSRKITLVFHQNYGLRSTLIGKKITRLSELVYIKGKATFPNSRKGECRGYRFEY